MIKTANGLQLLRRGDEVFVRRDGEESRTPVKLVWARPISARGGEICLVDRDKREVGMLQGLHELDEESRRIAEEELARRYLVPRITRVIRTSASFGVRYWHVETDLGERTFALRHASKNAVWIDDDHLVLCDALGCRYEIRPYSALDARSRAEVEKVI